MRILIPMMILMILVPFTGCTESLEESLVGPDSNVDEVHVWQDGWTSDTTICQQAIVLEGGDAYTCTFSLSDDDWIVIDLDVNTATDPVDLITMDEINYQQYQDGEAYYYLEQWTDFETFGGQYGKDVEFPQGDWVVLIVNPI
tara:strand:- start:32 stop:460 length:429 start_codon:yes stop_codon:yes gene_type:complete